MGFFLSSNIRTEDSLQRSWKWVIGTLVSYPKVAWQSAHLIQENVWVLLQNLQSANLIYREVLIWIRYLVWINHLHLQLQIINLINQHLKIQNLYLENRSTCHFKGIQIDWSYLYSFESKSSKENLKFTCHHSILKVYYLSLTQAICYVEELNATHRLEMVMPFFIYNTEFPNPI